MRDPVTIATETTPADTYDALVGMVGKTSQRVINGLQFIGTGHLFGRAITLRSLPARPDYVKKVQEESKKAYDIPDLLSHAISLCDKKNVLIVDASGYHHSAIAGGTKIAALAARSAAGLITDGALRDRDEFERYAKEYGMHTACSGWTVQSGTASTLYPSDVNIPISVHGVLVRPGDYLFGDENAVLVIPEEHVEEALETGVVHSKFNDYVTAKLEETKGILGRDIRAKDPDFKKQFRADITLSERQTELFKKYMGGDVA